MLYLNDNYYDSEHFERCYRRFDAVAAISECKGRRLTVCLSDPVEWIALCLYVKARGGSVLPLHPTTPLEAARRLGRRSGSYALIFDQIERIELQPDSAAEVPPGLVQLSSGTTGEPKCIERSWEAIDRELEDYLEALPQAREMTPIIACPVTHSYGLICGVLASLARGQEAHVLTQLNPKYVLRKLAQLPQPLLYAAPTLLHVLTRLLPQGEKLFAVMTSGAVMPKAHFEALRERSVHLFQQYGCSEAGCVAINTDTRSACAMGRPLARYQVESGSSADAPSEVIIRGAEQAIYTRDLGYFDSDGVLHYLARIDDMINVAGINVYPKEVEDVVLTCEGVVDVVVFKRADPYAGERVCLQFVADRMVDEDELRRWCAEHLSPYQCPLEIAQVEEIPKLPNGKISRRLLADQVGHSAEQLSA
ncbi:AMP-binding protein [Marinobacterium lutimaris]|uniref:Fatty-acyl-CoA synthase n=1 Tax=Marinobacterium lutimaris TaxID=568106 RepID=A0A1H5WK40_9GAMM|nr:AMP-binding protein [Marinobacterium lutimaris]SEF99733.1 fatty-acyl-CoA synthase [Marinobacterium lutimaris]